MIFFEGESPTLKEYFGFKFMKYKQNLDTGSYLQDLITVIFPLLIYLE